MEVFLTTLNQMLVLFLFIAAGYIIKKKDLVPENAATLLSKVENMIFIPALVIYTFMTRCTLENLKARSTYIIVAAIILGIANVASIFIAKPFTDDPEKRRIFRYCSIITSGFTGNAVMLGVFGSDMLFDFIMFSIPGTIFSNSVGYRWLTPDHGTGIIKRSFLKSIASPPCIALVIGMILGVTQLPLPDFLVSALSSASSCMSPVAMVLTGFVIGNYNVGRLLKNLKVHIMSFLRMIVIPLAFVLPMKLMHIQDDIVIMALCYLCMPLGLYTIVVPSAYGGDTTLGASLTLTSNLYAVITIPMMFSIFIH